MGECSLVSRVKNDEISGLKPDKEIPDYTDDQSEKIKKSSKNNSLNVKKDLFDLDFPGPLHTLQSSIKRESLWQQFKLQTQLLRKKFLNLINLLY